MTAVQIAGYRMLVGGEWVDARSGETFESVNPYTGRAWAEIPRAGAEDVDAAVRAARSAFDGWSRTTASERGRQLRRLAELIADNAERIAIVETTDNGKLIREMEGQLRGLADYYHYYAGAADKVGGETLPSDRSSFFVYTLREPLGVVAAITPWNSPVLLMSWKAAPALAAGCTLVVKPAEQAPASTLEFAALVEEAGFPPGVFNVVTGYGPEAGGPLVAHPGVDKVAFTGGTATGCAVMRSASVGDVDNGMGIARDEIFGPVLAALRFGDEQEAVRLVNDTTYGLAAGVWTRDVQRAHRMARALRAGTVWVNAYRAVGPMAPFGGFKASGIGRENGLQAVSEYTELKIVWIELTGATRDPFQLG